ncbi:hypothetical protein [Edaphobacter acidisoli]|nr:hypothetical protein [Edaphobacter acidisoli]
MNKLNIAAMTAVAAVCLAAAAAPQAQAQLSIQIGPAPVCPYGYYAYAPYNCAPYGYYGPEWFSGGVFVGAGPWFHGSRDFHGHVDDHFDPHHGYHGHLPQRGEHADSHRGFSPQNFHGKSDRDAHGNQWHGKDNHGH